MKKGFLRIALSLIILFVSLDRSFGMIHINGLQGESELPCLIHSALPERFFDVTGRKIFFVGKEDGSGELWSPPFQMLAEFVPLYSNGKNIIPLIFYITQAFSSIEFATPSGSSKLTYYALPEKPGLLLKIETTHATETLKFRLSSTIRPNWPLTTKDLGPVTIRSVNYAKSKAVSFERYEQQKVLVGGMNLQKIDILPSGTVYIDVSVTPCQPTYIAITGIGRDKAETLFLDMINNPEIFLKNTVDYANSTVTTFPKINIMPYSTTNKYIGNALSWAMIGADRMFMETDGVGSGYVAGYNISGSTTGPDFVPSDNGRPGFAWYFGRDFLWMSMALSITNQWEKEKHAFRLLRNWQGANGKIMHELTTSVGLMGKNRWEEMPYYFAAADSTPLYIIALRRFLDSSADIGFVKELWPSISLAFNWLITTDYDKDGLIDNFEGHGWVEGGPLAKDQIAKGHTTFYLAGLYVRALKDMAYMSKLIGDINGRDKALKLLPRAKEQLEAYWNEGGYYNHRKYPDGTYGVEKTIAPAVPILFGVADIKRSIQNLRVMNDASMQAAWGARFVSSDDPSYNSAPYHAGNVWPLFTGWLSLANYKYGLFHDGYTSFMANLQHTYNNALGFIGETYKGDRYVEVGTPHQGWSETAILAAFMEGLLGLKMDALNGKVYLNPQFPASMDSVHISNLFCGDKTLDFVIVKKKDGSYIVVSLVDDINIILSNTLKH